MGGILRRDALHAEKGKGKLNINADERWPTTNCLGSIVGYHSDSPVIVEDLDVVTDLESQCG